MTGRHLTVVCDHDEGPGHDCSYVNWRNSLIEAAEGVADYEAGPEAPKDREAAAAWSEHWDAAFHGAMARLAADPQWRRLGRAVLQ